ncbi:MAG: hypothetical protein IKA58_06490 [Clostridia bacterium]|nr:hypothetical protein [Clostridia bacterium]
MGLDIDFSFLVLLPYEQIIQAGELILGVVFYHQLALACAALDGYLGAKALAKGILCGAEIGIRGWFYEINIRFILNAGRLFRIKSFS